MTFLCFLWKFYLNVSGLVKYVPGERPDFYHYWKSFKGFSKQEIQSNDEKCLLWFIIASLHPVQLRNNQFRVSKCQGYGHELNKSGIKYFVDIKAIGKFEHQNSISVNVYRYEDKQKSSHYVLLLWPLQDIT